MTDEAEDADVAAPNLNIRWPSLRFVDPEVEHRFAIETLVQSLPIVRLFLVAASLLFGCFAILDYYVIPDAKAFAWTLRFGVGCPVLIAVCLFSFHPVFVRVAQPMLSLAMATPGFGIMLMTAVAAAPGNALYYAGLIMVVIYGSTLIRLRWSYAALISLTMVGCYEAVALWINPISGHLLLNNTFFLAISVGVGIFSSYVQEYLIRRDFSTTEMLRREKARSDTLLTAANAANKAKGDFLAIVSHELRTPLNAVLGFTEVMQRRMFGPLGSDRYVAYIDDIHHAAEHLLGIITDILDLSKAEIGKLTLVEEEVDLTLVLDQCIRLLREKAAEAGLYLAFKPPPVRPLVRADARLVKQVFLNLLSNAIKFTPSGGAVNVVVERDPEGGWLLEFADTGVGIAESDLSKVLEPFVQVESAFARKHGGTGLGLPLAKKVVELHGGTLRITSTLGVGTTVLITFPASRALAEPEQLYGAA
jgi:two-component system, cell cycle sensor histidine kinase PleC